MGWNDPEIRRGVGKPRMQGLVMTESESVEVDEWLISSGCIELNPNTPCSSSDSCDLVAGGEDGICECDRGEVNAISILRRGKRWIGSGPTSRACEKGIRMKIPFAKPTAASFLGSRSVVGGSVLVLILDGVGNFPSLFALPEYNGLDVDQQLPCNNLN
jgi:hypothetical protein